MTRKTEIPDVQARLSAAEREAAAALKRPKAKRMAKAARLARWRRFQDRAITAPEPDGLTVQNDAAGTWLVCRISDGVIVADAFTTNAAAWRWIDAHGDNALEIKRDRVANAFRDRRCGE
ncbi:MAG: hypothetical protein C0480_01165 [Bradyrhizobium sp.]|nr:hypothetical protein [Bradyrhizobium sp.]